ncbi:MAG: hypothetical protein JXJ22_10885 [Bacteroidales bacterium]|nr:hypothetical protein [Bacteroidales bacterium]
MELKSISAQEHYKSMNLIFVAMLLGSVLIAGVFVFLVIANDGGLLPKTEEVLQILKVVLLVFILIIIPGSYLFHKKYCEKIDKKIGLDEKLTEYKKSLIIKLALIESLHYFNLILFLLSGDYYLLIIVGLLIFLLIINRPSVEKIISDLSLSFNERAKFRE